MDDKRIVKRVYEARETGKRPRGRPRKTWKEGLQEVTRKKGVTWKEKERRVKDREKWKALWDPPLHRNVEEDGISKTVKNFRVVQDVCWRYNDFND
jgi:hypothetical protein